MRSLFLLVLPLAGCGAAPDGGAAVTNLPELPAAAQAPASKPPALVPRPADQAELDRLIVAGYTPHSDHLHAPGVDECPLSKGSEAVM